MANNKSQTDRIHELMPKLFKTRTNPNWKAIIEAIGEQDDELAELIQEVRKQFFVATANRPYLDRLGSNVKVERPPFIGMDDVTFRDFIPIVAYQPKQVKLVMDQLLDIFFSKDSTTAFTQSVTAEPFALEDGWELEYIVDADTTERVTFNAADFGDITMATADEVAAVINRSVNDSFAIVFDDRILQQKFIRIFTTTIGSKGSVQITNGLADIALQFQGFNDNAGSQNNTVWTITKVGSTMTFEHTSGNSPGLSQLQVGDVALIDIENNRGSFTITDIDVANNKFSFVNIFGTATVHDHSLFPDSVVRFMTPEKIVVFNKDTRAVVWEVTPGQIIVEMPATPPVVRRNLLGSMHVNGLVSNTVSRDSATSLTVVDASDFPTGGKFVLQEQNEIQTRHLTVSEDTTLTYNFDSRFDKNNIFTYTGKTGNQLTGITPDLPEVAGLFESTITTAIRDTANTVTVTTAAPHGYAVGEGLRIQDTVPTVSGDPAINLDISVDGYFTILSTPTTTTFTYTSVGDQGEATGGTARVERIGMSNSESQVYITSAETDTGIVGAYIWDETAPFVLSSLTANIVSEINAGNTVKLLEITTPNNLPDEESFVIFDYGTEQQEGPVRYFFKPSDNTIKLDPAYVFQFNHAAGSSVTAIRRRGAHVMSGRGTEYPPYIFDPGFARETLQELLKDVKSVGIFIEFLIRYPEQFYATLDVYSSSSDTLWPVSQ